MKTMDASDRADQHTADAIFEALGTYERGQLAALGTAFTTYEDLGDNVCKWLEARARSWRASQVSATEQGS